MHCNKCSQYNDDDYFNGQTLFLALMLQLSTCDLLHICFCFLFTLSVFNVNSFWKQSSMQLRSMFWKTKEKIHYRKSTLSWDEGLYLLDELWKQNMFSEMEVLKKYSLQTRIFFPIIWWSLRFSVNSFSFFRLVILLNSNFILMPLSLKFFFFFKHSLHEYSWDIECNFSFFFCENVKKIKSQQTVQNLYNNPLRASLLHERHFGLTFLFLIIPHRKKIKSDRFETSINQKPQHMHKNIESLNNLNGDSYNHIFILNPLFVNFLFSF